MEKTENRSSTYFSGSLSPRARGALPLVPSACARPLETHATGDFQRGGGVGRRNDQRGFTLVEMLVAVALFSIVMLVSVGALLALVGANRKAQALQSVMNNLNIALDGMVRSIRMGSEFHCGGGTITTPQSCEETGDARFAFKPFCDENCDPSKRWVYVFDTDGTYCGEDRLCKSENNGTNYYAITAPEVTIDSMRFYVAGTVSGDTTQPKVVLEVKGTAGALQIKTRTTFNIQATAVQRVLDL